MDFKAIYNRTNFLEFLRDKLLPEDFLIQSQNISLDFKTNYFKKITFLGTCNSLNLNVFEIYHSSENDARVGLSREAFKLVSQYLQNNAIILFIPENSNNFRLSLVCIEPRLDAAGVKILKQYSNPRRYSFLLGQDAKTHTPEQYLIAKGRIIDIDDLKKRFSVEVVNKEFYGKIAEMFSKLVGGKRKNGNKTNEYSRSLVLPSVAENDDQKYKEFAVRLIGRTVFCWFLKNKKSNNGIPLIGNNVLSSFEVDFSSDFYHQRVEPLFFEVLNSHLTKRKPEFKKPPFDSIPFLNGGLFEPHSDDYYSNKSANYALKIPNIWWKEFLAILETYNFTIDENTSIDIDLSVDPEMLGRIFENLLAEINPETGETARKSTGSYYTPRAIVEYMVDQSLKQFLITKTDIEPQKFDILLDYANESSGLDINEEQKVMDAVGDLKILDPACGSGAFPMGMLQKILLILQKIDNQAVSSFQQVLNSISDPVKRDLMKRKLEAAKILNDVDFEDYSRKLSVIQKSIYGIDIQPVAVDISRLRFFLSLVVDEVIQDDDDNRGIEPLPNLDFKFVCANSLIPLPEPDSFENMFGETDIVEKLENIRIKYFTASNDDKPQLQKEFEKLQKDLYYFITKNKDILSNPNSRLNLLAAWQPFSDQTTPWFCPKWMFGVENGFDIVIGNPPYVQLQKNGGYLADLYSNYKYETFSRMGDIYCLFIEKGLNSLKNKGTLTMITSNKWMRAGYGENTRKFLSKKSNPILLIDFAGQKVFENATVDTNILITQKTTNAENTDSCIVTELNDTNLNDLINKKKIKTKFNNSESWVILNSIEQRIKEKIEKIGTPLKDWDIKINYGIKTGFNEAFIIDGKKKDELIKQDPKSAEIIRPILRGRDIKRYTYDFADLWLIFVPWHFPLNDDISITGASEKAEKEFKLKFPAIYNHLFTFKEQLSNRNKAETGIRYEWYALQRWGANYWDDFYKQKIVWKAVGRNLAFSLLEAGYFITAPASFITSEFNLFLLAILTSSYSKYFIYNNSDKTGAGDIMLNIQSLENIYIPKIEENKINLINKIVEKIIENKNKSISTIELENEIDNIIYNSFEFTKDEIKFIENL